MAPQIRDIRLAHDGWTKIRIVDLAMPNGDRLRREVEDHGRAVALLPYDPERRVALLIRQFRAPVFVASGIERLLEAPAGLLEEDDPAECARREAYEETGLRLDAMEPVADVWNMPGVSTERMQLFLAPYREGDRVGPGGGLAEEGEDIEVVEMPLAELAAMSERGEITDAKTLTMLLALRLRQPHLFGPDPTSAV